MPTDDERREVAARLRDSIPADLHLGRGNKAWGLLYLTLFGRYMPNQASGRTYKQVAELLADLIEPVDRNEELCAHCDYCRFCDLPKCSEQDGYSFKPKGYVDLLVLADMTIRSARNDTEVCGDTVPAWYAEGRLKAVAQSIREILEVSHG